MKNRSLLIRRNQNQEKRTEARVEKVKVKAQVKKVEVKKVEVDPEVINVKEVIGMIVMIVEEDRYKEIILRTNKFTLDIYLSILDKKISKVIFRNMELSSNVLSKGDLLFW